MAKVLIVDDEPGYRASIEFFLAHAGHQVRAFSTLHEAVATVQDFQPDVLVADWVLGDRRTGAELARELTASHPQLQVILITGLPTRMVREQAADLDVFRLVEKPFEPQELVQAVEDAMHRTDADHGPVGS